MTAPPQMSLSNFSDQLFKDMKTELTEPASKRSRLDEGWSSSSASSPSSGSSPSHSEGLNVDTNNLRTALASTVSCGSDEGSVNEDGIGQTSFSAFQKPLIDSIDCTSMNINTDSAIAPIGHDSKFSSFAEFEVAFDHWKREQLHPFRVASSETLKEPDGTVDPVFKYRYVVYHCAHYGEPRMRGAGKRPNQSYLPCGCHAMLRLNYNFNERVLKITTLVTEHTGHAQTPEVFQKVVSKMKSSPAGSPATRIKRERVSISSASPLSYRSPATSASSSHQTSPKAAVAALSRQNGAGFSTQNAMLQEQQQLLAALMQTQQKENLSLLAHQQLQYALGSPLNRNTPSGSGALLNILELQNMMNMPFMQPAHGVVAPAAASEPMPTAVQDQHLDVVSEFSIPANHPAPVPVRMNQQSSPPPQLKAEVPFGNELTPLRPVSSALDSRAELHGVLLSLPVACSGCSEEEAKLRVEQLKTLKTQWAMKSQF